MSSVDMSGCQIFIDPLLELRMIGLQHQVKLGMVWFSTIFKLNVKIYSGPVQRENIEVFLSENLWEYDCPVRSRGNDMCDGPDHRAGFLCTPLEFYLPGNPIN